MKKKVGQMTLEELRQSAPNISFPEYQRESTVWDRRKQQRLIDSIMRDFDISALYFYQTEDGELECIDGRQRITAILSFTGDLEGDEPYGMLFENEIAPDERPDLAALNGLTFRALEESDLPSAQEALERLKSFPIATVTLSESQGPFEFNLQFTRLNLGTILNSGEKLNAMEGDMHDLCFGSIGKHPFLRGTNIATRRYAVEQVAAQFLSEIYSLRETGEFRRIRHLDLQKFFKQKFRMSEADKDTGEEVKGLLAELEAEFQGEVALFRNRALTVSVVLLAWENRGELKGLLEFWKHFTSRLGEQLEKIKSLEAVEDQYRWLVDFQKDVTQASVERPAIARRHETLKREFARFRAEKKIRGDA